MSLVRKDGRNNTGFIEPIYKLTVAVSPVGGGGGGREGGVVAQSVKRATHGVEFMGSISRCDRPLPIDWFGVDIM